MKNKLAQLSKKLTIKYRVIIVFGFAWSWLLMVDVARIGDSTLFGYSILFGIYAILVGLSAYILVKAIKTNIFNPNKLTFSTILKIVLCWAALELFIAWVIAAIFWGSGSSWDDMFPFGSLTFLIMQTPLKYLTRIFGYFGTSAVVGTGILLIYHAKYFSKKVIVYWLIVIGLSTMSYLTYRTPSGTSLDVTIVSETISEPRTIDTEISDFILLPEYGLDKYDSSTVHERFEPTNREIYFSGTKLDIGDEGSRNVLIYGSNKQGYIEQHNKSRLIVGGEFMSYPAEVILKRLTPVIHDQFKLQRNVIKGTDKLKTFDIPVGIEIGNASCSSIMNFDDYRKLTGLGADVLANSASLEIFRGSRLFEAYHDGFAKFSAVANARPFLQSSNNWKAFALDHNGKTVATVRPTGTREVSIQTNSKKTPYTYLGDWVAVLGGAYLLFLVTELLYRKYIVRK